jgi:16S rRNA C967 or C1407 C5-methylase (RsmB/RsmF family)
MRMPAGAGIRRQQTAQVHTNMNTANEVPGEMNTANKIPVELAIVVPTYNERGNIEKLVSEQARLLQALWPLLASGGMLLYCTCSVLADENSGSVARFLETQADAAELPIAAAWGRECRHGRLVFPGEDEMDGFYFACLTRIG